MSSGLRMNTSEDLLLEEPQKRSENLVRLLQDWLQESEGSEAERLWRFESQKDYQYYAGKQDDPSVLAKLRADERPTSVFNEIKVKIDTLVGLADELKLNLQLYPVGQEDEPLAEVANSLLKHHQRRLIIEDVELDCFTHALKGGRSLQGFYIDTSNPFKPVIETSRVEGADFFLDPLSRDFPTLSDARYLFISKWLGIDKLEGAVIDQELFNLIKHETNAGAEGDRLSFYDSTNRMVRLTECWYRVWDKVIWFVNPITQEVENLPPGDFNKLSAQIKEGLQVPLPDGTTKEFQDPNGLDGIEKKIKKVRYAIFAGDHIIEESETPFTGYLKDHFPYTLYGAYKDEDRNKWFSAIHSMKDPQNGLNTLFRQLIHLLQTSPKGLLFYEQGTIPNIKEYQESSSKSNFAMSVQRGALNEKRIMFTDQPNIPTIYERLMAVMEEMIKDISGVRDALLGIPIGTREPGITMQMRQQSGMTGLVELFKRYKKSRIHGTKILFSLAQQYTPHNEVIRVFPQAEQILVNGVDLEGRPINDVSNHKFDLYVDEGVEGKTMRLANAKILTDFAQNNPGSIPPDVLVDQTELSWSAKQRIREFSQQQQELQVELQREQDLLDWAKVTAQGNLKPTAKNIEALRKEATKTRDNITKEKSNA